MNNAEQVVLQAIADVQHMQQVFIEALQWSIPLPAPASVYGSPAMGV